MTEPLLYLLLLLLLINAGMLALLLRRSFGNPMAAAEARLDLIDKNLERTERLLRDEMSKNREESKQDRYEDRTAEAEG